MAKYRVKLQQCRPVEVEADDEQEALNEDGEENE